MACAMPTLCNIPFENLRNCTSPESLSPTRSNIPETSAERLQAREKLLATLNALSSTHSARSFGGMERFYDQAFDTLTSPKVAKVGAQVVVVLVDEAAEPVAAVDLAPT